LATLHCCEYFTSMIPRPKPYGVLRPLITAKNIALLALVILALLLFYRLGRGTTVISTGIQDLSSGFKVLSWKPRVFLWRKFVSDEEADHILEKSAHLVERSKVATEDGAGAESTHRTSYGVFISHLQDDPIVKGIESRIAEWTHIPSENGETMYLLRYEKGQEYKPHHDFFSDEENVKRGGNRVATVVMYLAEPEEGGETIFPKIGLEIPIKKGDAVLFWDYKTDNTPDDMTLHAGKPVLKGTKWALTRWLRMRKFE